MKNMKRLLSLLLVLVMLVGLVPNLAFKSHAAEETPLDALVVISDLHIGTSGSSESSKATLLQNVLTQIRDSVGTVSSVNSAGDMFSSNESTVTSDTSKLEGYIRKIFPNVAVNYTWTDHDRNASSISKKSSLTVYDNYYVYNLSMGDLCSNDRYTTGFAYTESDNTNRVNKGFTATVPQAIADFQNAVKDLDKNKPLFIVGHQPLFDNRNDNAWAEDWVTAINTVAATMDVTYFFGHNHNYDLKYSDNDYYYAKGSSMPVPKKSDWDFNYNVGVQKNSELGSTNVTIQFTHICAGYLDPATGSNNSNTRKNTAVAAVIYDDHITYTAYNQDGVYKNTSKSALELDVEVERKNKVTNEGGNQTGINVITDPNTGISVSAVGITGVSASVVANPVYDATRYGVYAAFNINVEGYTQGNEATVSIPVPSSFDANKNVFVIDQGVVIANTPVVDGKITFKTNHFSQYDVAQLAESSLSWTQISEAGSKDVFKLVNSFTNNKKYLVVNKNTTGEGNAVGRANNGGVSEVSVNIEVEGNTVYISDAEANAQWTYNTFLTQTSGRNTYYLYAASGTNLGVTNSNSTEYTRWSYDTTNGLRAKQSSRQNKYRNFENYYIYEESTIATSALYAAVQGVTSFNFIKGVHSMEDITAAINKALSVYIASDAAGTGMQKVDYVLNGTVDTTKTGTTTLAVMYNGYKVCDVTVQIKDMDLSTAEVIPAFGTVTKNASDRAEVGADIKVSVGDGEFVYIPVTLGMLYVDDTNKASAAEITTLNNLMVVYNNVQICDNFTLNVVGKEGNNYPESPNEGAVKVSKSGTGINFQSTGLARVEVSAYGVPMQDGADVIIMLDTSSSMNSNTVSGTKKTRLTVLKESLANLINQFKTSGPDNGPLDVKVAIADFNGFYYAYDAIDKVPNGTPYDQGRYDYVGRQSLQHSTSSNENGISDAKIYTYFTDENNPAAHGTVDTSTDLLTQYAFVPAKDLKENYDLNYHKGTNYDYGLDAVYQLGTHIKAVNELNGEADRPLYVIFMSDGATFQWNYYHSYNSQAVWGDWITGEWDTLAKVKQNAKFPTESKHTYYYNLDDTDDETTNNEHRMALAIKGDPDKTYEIIRQSRAGLESVCNDDTLVPESEVIMAQGDVYANDMYRVPGLGAKLYVIDFDSQADGSVVKTDIETSLQRLATPNSDGITYYTKVTTADGLKEVFTTIGKDITYAAYNARFVDQMGKNYNLPLGALKDLNGKLIDANGNPTTDASAALANTIEILSYEIYTLEDYENRVITDRTKVGSRKLDADGHPITKVIETVTIHANGTVTSNLIDGGNTNILATEDDGTHVKGVIYAKNFYYNTNTYDVTLNGINIPTGIGSNNLTTGSSNVLPGETFYWNMGTVKTTELAMRYYVYLDGSMEGHREAGSYATNEFAILYYDNYLDNPCYKETVSPVLAWKSANVSYAFYLVNDKGEVIKNQTTGATGTFADRIAITNPVVFDEILLNDEGAFLDVVTASEVLPDYYVPFDGAASYLVDANSDGSGSWTITGGKVIDGNTVYTTYVTGYDLKNAAAYTHDTYIDDDVHDYTHTTVWFAVELVTQAHPDTVVIDYGLPVEISVLSNDMFGENGKLAGVGAIPDSLNLDGHYSTLADGFNGYESDFGTATANPNTGKVTYTPSSMQMNTYDKFAYAVNYTGDVNAGYYYDTVTVIPATTIYYEDSFLTYTASNTEWMVEGTAVEGATQGEDRPGKYSITDANNIYGYDSVNKSMSTFSLGTAKKVHVDKDSFATAEFTFYGTGFDIISMTSNTTGVLAVKVTAADTIKNINGETIYNAGDKVKATMINTYYGCSYEQTGVDENNQPVYGWVSKPDVDQAMYQVPIMQIEELPYGKYDVLMTATYNSALDEGGEDGYWLYLDAVRIYDPANDGASDDVLHHVTYTYNADSKKWVRTVGERAASDAIPTDAVFPKDPTNGMTVTAIENIETTIEDAYKQDGEGWPSYIELRNKLLDKNSFDDVPTNTQMNGLVFIDGMPNVSDGDDITTDQDGNFVGRISDYKSFGPNNEVYLKSGQSVAFQLTDARIPVYDKDGKPVLDENGKQKTESIVAGIHIGVKSADGKIGKYAIKNVASADISTSIKAGTAYGEKSFTVDTTTDMYYDLSAWKNDIIVISNTGAATDGIISITNIKATYNADPNDTLLTGDDDDTNKVRSVDPINNEVDVFMTYDSAALTLRAINGAEDQKPDAPQPEDPKPEDPKPEEPKPEEPEVFDPEVTVTVNKDSVKVNQSVQVKVYTDSDVASVEINGNMITKYSVEKKTGRRIWSTNVTAIEAGELEIEVVASNAEGVKAEPVVKTVTVTEKNNGNGNNGNAGNKPNANNKPVTGIPGSNAMSNFLNNIMNLFKNFWRR